jgi:hypothetical protein
VVTEVLWPRPGSSVLVADLSEVPGEVAGLIINVVFHGTSGVLMSVASHYPTLDFGAVGRGYAAGWSTNQLCELGQSLGPVVMAITETTTPKWVKEVQRVEREATWGGGGIQAIEAGSSAAPTEPALNQGNPPIDPATWLVSSTSSASADKVP